MFQLLVCLLLYATSVKAGRTIILGDSMFAGGSSIPSLLEDWAGHAIENYAKVGSSLQEGWVISVPHQYDMIPSKSNITTVIMDGGGNDVFSRRQECLGLSENCKQNIRISLDIVGNMLEKMETNQVDHVIYLGFYYAKGLNKAIDFGMQELSTICNENGVIPCFLVDPRNFSIPLGWDGVHPTSEGYRRLATAIWDISLANDIII